MVDQIIAEEPYREAWTYQDVGVEGGQVKGAVAVDLEPDAGVDAVEERTEEEPRAEERGGDGRPGAPQRQRLVFAAAVLEGVGGFRQRQPGGLLAATRRGEVTRRWRCAGDEHGESGGHVPYPVAYRLWASCSYVASPGELVETSMIAKVNWFQIGLASELHRIATPQWTCHVCYCYSSPRKGAMPLSTKSLHWILVVVSSCL
jgi:hypothetical protein